MQRRESLVMYEDGKKKGLGGGRPPGEPKVGERLVF